MRRIVDRQANIALKPAILRLRPPTVNGGTTTSATCLTRTPGSPKGPREFPLWAQRERLECESWDARTMRTAYAWKATRASSGRIDLTRPSSTRARRNRRCDCRSRQAVCTQERGRLRALEPSDNHPGAIRHRSRERIGLPLPAASQRARRPPCECLDHPGHNNAPHLDILGGESVSARIRVPCCYGGRHIRSSFDAGRRREAISFDELPAACASYAVTPLRKWSCSFPPADK